MEIKSTSEIAEKWSRVTPQRTDDYAQGVRSPRRDWAQATGAAEDSYKQGVLTAAQQGRFGKGVKAAGTEKWQTKTSQKGTERWGPGVQVSRPDYEKGFAPYAEAIARVTLPPRFPAGDPRNIERVRVVAAALRQQKVKGSSA